MNRLRTSRQGDGYTIFKHDAVPYAHQSTHVVETSDFVYHGPALDLTRPPRRPPTAEQFLDGSYLTQVSKIPHALFNADGVSARPSEESLAADAFHGNCSYLEPSETLMLHEWTDTCMWGLLDMAFWEPLVRLLEFVEKNWLSDQEGVDDDHKRTSYVLTIRAVRFRDIPDLKFPGQDPPRPAWHTEWWLPTGLHPPTPTPTVRFNEPTPTGNLFTPTSPNTPSTDDHLSNPATPTHINPFRLIDHPSGLTTPTTASTSSTIQPPSSSATPTSTPFLSPPSPHTPTHPSTPTPAIRILAPLAGAGPAFVKHPALPYTLSIDAARGAFSTQPFYAVTDIAAPVVGEMAIFWAHGAGEGGGPAFAAPTKGMVWTGVDRLAWGRDRVVVSLVVGTKAQVEGEGEGGGGFGDFGY